MTEKDHTRGPEEERPRVKVTDRRRVRASEDSPSSPAQDELPMDPDARAGTPADAPGPGTDVEAARTQAAEYLDHLQRLKAEFDNYRKRSIKEQTRAMEMAAEPFVRKLLEVLDEFDLALMAAERAPEFERFLHGVELVYAKLLEIL